MVPQKDYDSRLGFKISSFRGALAITLAEDIAFGASFSIPFT
jgi:hypothetical protein